MQNPAQAARRVLEQKRGGWRGRWHVHNWWRSMERYVFPRIGQRPVSEVNTADVLEILSPIWHAKAATAREVRQRIRAVLEWAIALDMRSDNPCDRVVPVLGAQNDIVTHRQALPHKDVAAAIETVRTSKSGQAAVKLAFEFLVLTAARSGEVRLATWDEMDTAGRIWTVPALRMKAKREHRVPLCGRALEVLDAARALGDGGPLVFPMRSGRAISASTLPKMLQQHKIAAVAHGFRSSFRDWAAEKTDHPREVIEAALAHVVQELRWRPPTRGRTCSSVDGNSWTIGPSIWRAQAGEPGRPVRARAASPPCRDMAWSNDRYSVHGRAWVSTEVRDIQCSEVIVAPKECIHAENATSHHDRTAGRAGRVRWQPVSRRAGSG